MITAAWTVAKTFVKANPKLIKGLLIGGAAIAGVLAFNNWKGNLIEQADAAGFERARAAYQKAVETSNAREAQTQARLDQMVSHFGTLATARGQEINLTLKPVIEGIQNEVASDPRYRECLVSNSMLDQLNAGRAAVDASIAASNPR